MPEAPAVLITADDIAGRVAQLARAIRADAPGDLHLVAVLKGAFMFLGDLVRQLAGPVSVDFVALSSYAKGTTTSGEVRLLKDLDVPLDGRHVVIIEDIVDTGLTLAYLLDVLRARNPRSLRSACLLSKPSRRRAPVTVDYVGFDIDDVFVVGYGLDYDGQYRNLPYIGTIDTSFRMNDL